MKSNNGTKIAGAIAIVLMLTALGWGVFQSNTNHDLKSLLDEERLKSESILSEKLQFEKALEKANKQLKVLKAENQELESDLGRWASKDAAKDQGYAKLQKELAANRKKYAELDASRSGLENQIAELNDRMQRALADSQALNEKVASLTEANQGLKDELSRTRLASYDKPLIEPLRGKNDKLIAKAKKTQKLRANLIVPSGMKDVQFKVFDSNNKLVSTNDNGTLASRTITESINALASSRKATVASYKQVEMTFTPKQKLKPGVYTIWVFSENLEVGSLQVKLR